ncbi:MAG: VOC family protein [Geodermatophilaceae bacterium]
MSLSLQVSFDADDPPTLAQFWAAALGYVLAAAARRLRQLAGLRRVGRAGRQTRSTIIAALMDPDGRRPRLFFQKVPEGKQAKNRVHLDVNVGAPDHDWAKVTVARRAAAREAGGTIVEERTDEMSRWIVMLDPEGNEFCLQ